MKQTIQQITNWLQQKVKEAKVNGLVVGVSGGLDSAVVAYLIRGAFPENSLAVIMPIQTRQSDLQDAEAVVTGSGIQSMTVDLTEAHGQLYKNISASLNEKSAFVSERDQMANANLRARLRMSTLYTIASHRNYLVVGTDNASEWHTGYFTKYGDGGVDIQPITDFTKEEVRKLAEYLGVPEKIIAKQPSADLWEGQTDETEMGTTYERIDAYLSGETIPEQDQRIIERMHQQTEHKRAPLPRFKRS
ncbi:NAD(+) synthase [Lentibacillus sp. JNUCC-1]|uniref:NAD(+) synthase n=1 Tax=Lentibacillus sp. JNUCC-1 TaxID=2654513 RepID=UPI0012E92BF4|nr:NAD(+) synthase [Lentibacillus sp. JNUCC-1]MUV39512.1 NAD(+) synthase [Lentibacillus sp. JNUCC-1]